MLRPAKITHPVVVNDGKPFEGMSMELSFHIRDQDLYMTNYDDDKNDYIFHQSFRFNTLKELQDAKYSVQWQLAQALNPPVKVTQAVRDAMEKVPEAKFLVSFYLKNSNKYRLWYHTREGFCYEMSLDRYGEDAEIKNLKVWGLLSHGDYIQADCPLALQVLLGFTTEGVPKDD